MDVRAGIAKSAKVSSKLESTAIGKRDMTDNGQHSGRGHEPNVVSMQFVLSAAFGLVALIVLSMLVSGVLLSLLIRRTASTTQLPPSPVDTALERGLPRLDPDRRIQRQEQRAAEDKILNNYEWIDADAGLARIPIRRAMQILAHEGLPTRESRKTTE
jgi:hypothetical protein